MFQCEVFQLTKHHHVHFSSHTYQESKPFYPIHSDVWGPSQVTNIIETKWFIIFINDHTRVYWVYHLKEKSNVGGVFKAFYSMIET